MGVIPFIFFVTNDDFCGIIYMKKERTIMREKLEMIMDATFVMQTIGYTNDDIRFAFEQTNFEKGNFPETSDLISWYIKVIAARNAGRTVG